MVSEVATPVIRNKPGRGSIIIASLIIYCLLTTRSFVQFEIMCYAIHVWYDAVCSDSLVPRWYDMVCVSIFSSWIHLIPILFFRMPRFGGVVCQHISSRLPVVCRRINSFGGTPKARQTLMFCLSVRQSRSHVHTSGTKPAICLMWFLVIVP